MIYLVCTLKEIEIIPAFLIQISASKLTIAESLTSKLKFCYEYVLKPSESVYYVILIQCLILRIDIHWNI